MKTDRTTLSNAVACCLLLLLPINLVYAETKLDIQAAYVLFAQNVDNGQTVPLVRVVVNGLNSQCPSLISPDQSPPTLQPRQNPDPAHFPITVCEAIYPTNTALKIAQSDVVLPAVTPNTKDIIVFGDTGCKTSQAPCTAESTHWPFPALAAQAATRQADVVLHMGDYNYSGTPGNISINGQTVQVYDAGDNTTQGLCKIPGAYYGQNDPGSTQADSWQAWQSNFFTPAKPLLAAAPWVFTRGNHELCSRAGIGWFYLLDSNSPLLGKYASQLSCPATTNHNPIVLSPPYLLDLGAMNLVVLDSANACDSGLLHADDYRNQFALINALINNAKHKPHTWLQTHRPFWGVDSRDPVGACGTDASNPSCFISQTLQQANQQVPLKSAVSLILSGHMHRFQVVSFTAPNHPNQLVIGNGGVTLSSLYPKKTQVMSIDQQDATVMGVHDFGFMALSLHPTHWRGQLLNPLHKKPELVTCHSDHYPICHLQAGVK